MPAPGMSVTLLSHVLNCGKCCLRSQLTESNDGQLPQNSLPLLYLYAVVVKTCFKNGRHNWCICDRPCKVGVTHAENGTEVMGEVNRK